MKETGILFAVLGGALLAWALMMDVTVETEGLYGMPSRIANNHAMHLQSLVVMAGIGSAIVGALLFGFGAMVEALKRQGGAAEPAPAPQPTGPYFSAKDWQQLGYIVAGFVALMVAIAIFFPNSNGAGDAAVNNVVTDAENAIRDADNALREAVTDPQ